MKREETEKGLWWQQLACVPLPAGISESYVKSKKKKSGAPGKNPPTFEPKKLQKKNLNEWNVVRLTEHFPKL